MENTDSNPFKRENLTDEVIKEWQKMLDETAEIFSVPAGLITRVDNNEIEILLSSKTDDNPYKASMKSKFPDSKWYCEQTLKSRGLNLISNALSDPEWKDNPAAVDLNMVSYLGMPIERPDGGLFGTVCFLDNKENSHNDIHIKFIQQIKRMVELSLKIVYSRFELEKRDLLINSLIKIYPICSYCKKIKKEAGNWVTIEKYVGEISGAEPSHGICPQCYAREMKRLE